MQSSQLPKAIFAERIKAQIQQSPSSSPFQIKMIVFLMLTSFFSNMQFNSSHYLYMNPAFNCEGVEGKQTEAYACDHLTFCTISNTIISVAEPTPVTAELHLYCDQRTNDRIFIQSANGIGNWLGTIFVAMISDRFGRGFCFIFALIFLTISCIIQFIGINSEVASLLIISETLYGFAGKIVYVSFLIISTRFLKKSLYQIVTIGWLIVSSLSVLLISLLNTLITTWKGLFYIYAIGIAFLTVCSFFVLYEDPIFYFQLKEYEKCKEVLRSIGRENGECQQQIEKKIMEVDECIEYNQRNTDKIHQKGYSLGDLLRWDIILLVLVIGLVGCCFTIAGLGIDYSIQGLKLSYNQNLFLTGLATLFGQLTAIYIIQAEQKKKRGFLFTSIICGIAGFFFAFPFCLQNAIVESIIIVIMRVTLAWINNFYIRMKVDIFPEKYQGFVISVIECITNVGRVISPEIIQLSTTHHMNPIFATNLLRVTVGTLPILLISEEKISIKKSQRKDSE